MKKLVIHDEANEEYAEAVAYFDTKRAGLGADFRAKVVATLRSVRRNPKSGQLVKGTQCRRQIVDRFRYKVIFLELDDQILVVAAAHPSRAPDYWLHRLDNV